MRGLWAPLLVVLRKELVDGIRELMRIEVALQFTRGLQNRRVGSSRWQQYSKCSALCVQGRANTVEPGVLSCPAAELGPVRRK